MEDARTLLQSGIAAAKQGNRAEARTLLARAVRADSQNAAAWLWLSGVLDDPKEQAACLQRVLAIDPANDVARRGLARLQGAQPEPKPEPQPEPDAETLLRRGIAAVEAGDDAQARELLLQVVDRQEDNVAGWWWLSRVIGSDEDRQVCLENVLALNPGHVQARAALDELQGAVPLDAALNPWGTPEEAPSSGWAQPSEVGAVLGWESDEQPLRDDIMPGWETDPDSPMSLAWQRYENELLCPYCAAPTEMDDKRCDACGKELWIKIPRREERSVTYWIFLFFQIVNSLTFFLLPVLLVIYASVSVMLLDVSLAFPVYFGGEVTLPAATVDAMLAIVPRWAFYLSWLPVGLGILLIVGYLARWPFIYYLLLFQAALSFLSAFVGLAQQGLLCGGVNLGFALAGLFLTISLEDDFLKEKVRLLTRVGRDAKDYATIFRRGRNYAGQGMWALAAVHFRRAAGMMLNHAEGYLALALVCIEMRDREIARYALDEVRQSAPDHQQLVELEARLAKLPAKLHDDQEPAL